jgi:MFS superfamily sulfate permease-like transporter
MNNDSPAQKKGIFSSLKQDLPASIVVFFVAVPLCLGIALASGAPLFSGLISGIIGGIIVGSISNSSLGVSGPAAGLAVIVLSSIKSLGGFDIFLMAVVLSGVFQIILGFLKGGIIGHYFPSSVIKGMLTGIGIIIFLKQIPHAFGYDGDYQGDLSFFQADGENTFSELINMLDYLSPSALFVSVVSLIIILVWDLYLSSKHKFFKLLQGPLIAVTFGVSYQLITSAYFPEFAILKEHLVSVPVAESLSGFAGQFSLPKFSSILNSEVWIVAGTITVVASLETLLSVEATDKLDPNKGLTNTNRELVAQGVGNMFSGLIGGLPVTQVIVRSSANIQSGGKSKLSAILHGVFMLVAVAIIPFVLNLIPLAVLASILFIVGFKLAKPSLFKETYQLGWGQFVPFIITVLGVVFTDLLTGIVLGVGVGFIILLRKSYLTSHLLYTETVDNEGNKKGVIKLAEEVTFINKSAIIKVLNNVPSGISLTIDMSQCRIIDYDLLELIDDYKISAKTKGIELRVIERTN